jgi:hypothetical protein
VPIAPDIARRVRSVEGNILAPLFEWLTGDGALIDVVRCRRRRLDE